VKLTTPKMYGRPWHHFRYRNISTLKKGPIQFVTMFRLTPVSLFVPTTPPHFSELKRQVNVLTCVDRRAFAVYAKYELKFYIIADYVRREREMEVEDLDGDHFSLSLLAFTTEEFPPPPLPSHRPHPLRLRKYGSRCTRCTQNIGFYDVYSHVTEHIHLVNQQ
jgi:hypothetical protein